MTCQIRNAVPAVVFLLFALPCSAGPCTSAIDQLQSQIDARLAAKADAGGYSTETPEATLHRQPTPGSIANAEAKLGELSPAVMDKVRDAMARARAADAAGDRSGCESAVAEIQKLAQ